MVVGWEGREGGEDKERPSPVALGASAAGIVLCPVGAIWLFCHPPQKADSALKCSAPPPAVRHAWCLIHTRGDYWERLGRKSSAQDVRGAKFCVCVCVCVCVCQFVESTRNIVRGAPVQSARGQACQHNCPEFFEPAPELHRKFEMYEDPRV